MTRIKYLENGIYEQCKSSLDDIENYFSTAKTTASSLSCPSWFSLKSYINKLDNLIGEYVTDLNDIRDKIRFADTEYEDVTKNMTDDVASLSTDVLEKRERLVL